MSDFERLEAMERAADDADEIRQERSRLRAVLIALYTRVNRNDRDLKSSVEMTAARDLLKSMGLLK